MPGWGVIPALRFADLDAAIDFYVRVLGFTVRRAPDVHANASLTYGDATVMLEAPADFFGEGYNLAIRQRLGKAGPNALYIEAKDLQALWDRVTAAGVQVVDPLAPRPWGQWEFTIEDLAGNWLTFWQKLPGN